MMQLKAILLQISTIFLFLLAVFIVIIAIVVVHYLTFTDRFLYIIIWPFTMPERNDILKILFISQAAIRIFIWIGGLAAGLMVLSIAGIPESSRLLKW